MAYESEYLRQVRCPVCKKMFYPAPLHVYHDSRGRAVCTWGCMVKSEKKEQAVTADRADLTVSIKKEWLDMIRSGKKREEYRDIKQYYTSRFTRIFAQAPGYADSEKSAFIRFRAGYSASSPSIIAECTLRIGIGRTEWGAEKGKEYYILTVQNFEDGEKARHG